MADIALVTAPETSVRARAVSRASKEPDIEAIRRTNIRNRRIRMEWSPAILAEMAGPPFKIDRIVRFENGSGTLTSCTRRELETKE